jgi:hypothetical protein
LCAQPCLLDLIDLNSSTLGLRALLNVQWKPVLVVHLPMIIESLMVIPLRPVILHIQVGRLLPTTILLRTETTHKCLGYIIEQGKTFGV